MRIFYLKNHPKQTCDYWFITPNEQTRCIETNIYYQGVITNQQVGNYKTVDNYKIISLTLQC